MSPRPEYSARPPKAPASDSGDKAEGATFNGRIIPDANFFAFSFFSVSSVCTGLGGWLAGGGCSRRPPCARRPRPAPRTVGVAASNSNIQQHKEDE